MEKYSDYVIDDADYVVTPDNEWYILDLENKQIDKELKVKVDKDGGLVVILLSPRLC